MAEGSALEMQQVGIQSGARVQIPPSPLLVNKKSLSQNSRYMQYMVLKPYESQHILCISCILQQSLFLYIKLFLSKKIFL